MVSSIATEPDTVGPGNIRFYDAVQPPLPAGDYTLTATQEIQGLEEGPVAPYLATQPFRVVAAPFAIDPAQIHSVYPPKGQTGNYGGMLPFVVFKNFALPWSRNIDPSLEVQAQDAPPWMAVLLVYASDMAGADPKVGQVDPATQRWVGPQTVAAADVTQAAAGVVVPDIPAEVIAAAPGDKAVVLQMKLDYFFAIAPTLEELPLLAHGRVVDTDEKIMLGMDADGCFSVLLGNRVPPREGEACTAFIVSLEGHQAHLPSAAGNPSLGGATSIRLVMLGSWSFTASASPGSFLELMGGVASRGGVSLLQASPPKLENPTATEALAIGYVPLPNAMRVGEQTTSWYRGPCTPAPTARDTSNAPYHYSDHAMNYDPETGLFDLGYAAAWQIGRLLALSDGPFALTLSSWRRSYLQATYAATDQSDVEARLDSTLSRYTRALGAPSPSAVGQVRSLLQVIGDEAQALFPRVRPRSPVPAAPATAAPSATTTGDPLLDLLASRSKGFGP